MKTLNVEKISSIVHVSEVSECFDREKIESHSVSVVNWDEYPYKPDVKFRIAHDGKNIYINWKVSEVEIKALCEEDGGEVWKDSCVEFFVSFDGLNYYNIETNCIGKILVETGSGRSNRVKMDKKQIALIQRWSSLGDKAVDNLSGVWELSVIIPCELFTPNSIESFDKMNVIGNFYKCGDDLRQPHFLSWNAIESEIPNFHVPEFFGKIKFK